MAQHADVNADASVEPFPYYGEDQEPAPPSSRLCVKNLPKHLKDDRLREHFAARGEVTDVKILKTRWVAGLFLFFPHVTTSTQSLAFLFVPSGLQGM